MTTTTPSKPASGDFPPPPPKPNRSVRLDGYDPETGTGSLTITDKGKADTYLFERIDASFGEAFLVLKTSEAGADPYAVNLDKAHGFHSCECMGWLRHGHCRHVGALLALGNRGKI